MAIRTECHRPAPYHGEQFADDLIVLAGEQPRAPVLVAASMGGLFGLLAESRWPGLFSAMVLVDITPRWDIAGVERILAFMTAHPDGFASLAQAADVISAYMPHRPRKSEQSLRALLRVKTDTAAGADIGTRAWWPNWPATAAAPGTPAEAARQVKCLLPAGQRHAAIWSRRRPWPNSWRWRRTRAMYSCRGHAYGRRR